MNNQILVTIVIPLYNKIQYFERCFNSVVKQTYNNLECIIIDDRSTDGSFELAEQLIKNYKGNTKFILRRHDKNSGPAITKNTGIDNSNGDYIFFLDSDDEITDNCISSLVELTNEYHGVDMVQGSMLQRYQHSYDIKMKLKLPKYVKGNLEIKKKYSVHIPPFICNKLIKKDLLNSNLYLKDIFCHEDNHWRFFLLKKLESFAFTDEYTYIWHRVPDSITTNIDISSSISGYLTIVEDMLSNLDIDLLDKQIDRINYLLKQQKKRISSNEKYKVFKPRYKYLKKKVPNGYFFILLAFKCELDRIKRILKGIVKIILIKLGLFSKVRSLRLNK